MAPSIMTVFAMFYGGIGLTFIVWPRQLQKFALRQSLGLERKYPALINLIGSWQYVVFLRAVGLASASAALLLLFAIAHHA